MEDLGSILVVDDDRANRELMSRRLRRRGYRVDTVTDGIAALERIDTQPYDLVLLDVVMPGLNGIEVLKRLRKFKPRAMLPVVMVTSMDDPGEIVDALRRGANDYVTKPVHVDVLLARVATHVILKRTADSLQQANEKLSEALQQLRDDLELAARVQRSRLPQSTPVFENYEFAWKFQPCVHLAGDNLNIMALNEDHVGFYVLDVSGHGTHAALLALAVNHLLHPSDGDTSVVNRPNRMRGSEAEPEYLPTTPKDVIDRLNRHFVFDPVTSHFFTIVYGILNLRAATWTYASTGHPPPLRISRDGAVDILDSSGMPIGILGSEEENGERYTDRIVQLQRGDRLYVYSDGLIEARNSTDQPVSVKGLADILTRSRHMPLKESLDAAFDAIGEWRGEPSFADDLSIVGLDVH
jgi:sigma-B regulation protein RsbU (phosphoserine phosphatase)